MFHLASFAFFGSSRFATPHRPGGTGVIEGPGVRRRRAGFPLIGGVPAIGGVPPIGGVPAIGGVAEGVIVSSFSTDGVVVPIAGGVDDMGGVLSCAIATTVKTTPSAATTMRFLYFMKASG